MIIPYNPSTYVLTTKEGVTYTIDEFEGLTLIEDANGNTITVTPGGLVSSTGISLTFQRDSGGRITKIIEPDDPNDADPPGELKYVYDAKGNLVAFRDQMDHQTDYFYENTSFPNYLTRIEDPLGRQVVRTVYDSDGRLIGQCDADGDPVTLVGCTQFDPDAASGIQTIINARGYRSDLILDEMGNILTERRWMDLAQTTYLDTVRTYDSAGNELSRTDPQGNVWTYTYDAAENRLSETKPGNRTWTTTYGSCNKPERECDPLGNCTTNTYDAACNLTFVRDPLGHVMEYRCDARGNRTHQIDAVGNQWLFHFDPVTGLPTGSTDPLGRTATEVRSSSGDLLTKTDRNGRQIDYQYDGAHRLIEETWNTVPPTTTTYAYDDVGRVTSAAVPDTTLTIDYWNTGRVQRVLSSYPEAALSATVTYGYLDPSGQWQSGYDGNGNVTHVTDSYGGHTRYDYDGLDRLSSIQQWGESLGDATEKRIDVGYDASSLPLLMRRWSDLAGTQPVAETLFEFGCPGCEDQMTAIRHRRQSDSTPIHEMLMMRDASGNILQVTDLEGVHTYGYDGVRRLVSALRPSGGVQVDEVYAYDGAGNRLSSHLSSSYSYQYASGPGGDALVQDDIYDYEYDYEGSMVRRVDRVTGAYSIHVYDHRQRLTSVKQYDGVGVLLDETTFRYDALNRRIAIVEDGLTRSTFYDDRNPILEVNAGGAVAIRRVYTRSIDQILADDVGGATRWFLTDTLGTVRDVIADDTTVLDHYVYDSFGRLLLEANPGFDNRILFTGREFDVSTGLGYFRARYHDARAGRFTQQDPRNPYGYQYADGNPLTNTDPLGEVTFAQAAAALVIGSCVAGGIASYYENYYKYEAEKREDWGEKTGYSASSTQPYKMIYEGNMERIAALKEYAYWAEQIKTVVGVFCMFKK